jgi:hypothetical protein
MLSLLKIMSPHSGSLEVRTGICGWGWGDGCGRGPSANARQVRPNKLIRDRNSKERKSCRQAGKMAGLDVPVHARYEGDVG